MTLEESIEFDDRYTNAKIRGLDKTVYFESHGNSDTKICKKCQIDGIFFVALT